MFHLSQDILFVATVTIGFVSFVRMVDALLDRYVSKREMPAAAASDVH